MTSLPTPTSSLMAAKHILSTINGDSSSTDFAPLIAYIRHLVSALADPHHPQAVKCSAAILSAMDAHAALETDPEILLAFVRSLVVGLVAQLPSSDDPHPATLPSPLKTPQSTSLHTIPHNPPSNSPRPRRGMSSRSVPASAPPKSLHGPSTTNNLLRAASGTSASNRQKSNRNQPRSLPPTFGGLQPFIDTSPNMSTRKRVFVPSSMYEEEENVPKRRNNRDESVEPIDSE